MERKKTNIFFKNAQIVSAAMMAFMHGAQDGQKFLGLGTSVGGKKIIKSVGMDMVKLEKYQGFSADLAAAFCILFSTLSGIPVSTTHMKTASILGVGVVKRLSAINYKVVLDMILTWVLTFPGCGLIGYAVAKIFLFFG